MSASRAKQRTQTNKVTVLLLRHGEREDEAAKRDRKRGTKTELPSKGMKDPSLTECGYLQAHAAFTNIEKALGVSSETNSQKKRVAIFCSPLRRTIGTAMMVGAAHHDQDRFALDLPVSWNDGVASTADIPIVVMNGLCDCAAYIRKVGGASSAVAMGLVDCAAMPANDNLNPQVETPLSSALVEMKSRSLAALSGWDASSTLRSTKFWKEAARNRGPVGEFVPMTPQFSLRSSSSPDISDEERKISRGLQRANGQGVDQTGGDDFVGAVNRAAFLTAKAGMDTCVIVSHREAIRHMAHHLCGYHPSQKDSRARLATPYCCIGTFTAEVRYTNRNVPSLRPMYSVKWTFHGVSPFEDFSTASLPQWQSGESLTCKGTTNVILAIPGEARHVICAVKSSPMETSAGIVFCELSLSSYQRTESYQHEQAMPSRRPSSVELALVDGRRRWLHFQDYLRQNDKVVRGVLTQVSPDGTKKRRTVVADFQSQLRLPCPPSTIKLDVW